MSKDDGAGLADLLADIRHHTAPIIVAVMASAIVCRLGLVVTGLCLLAGTCWMAWRTGWRIELSSHQNGSNQEEDTR